MPKYAKDPFDDGDWASKELCLIRQSKIFIERAHELMFDRAKVKCRFREEVKGEDRYLCLKERPKEHSKLFPILHCDVHYCPYLDIKPCWET